MVSAGVHKQQQQLQQRMRRRDDDDPDLIPAAAISQLVHNKLGKFLIGSRVTPHKCKEQLRTKKMLHPTSSLGEVVGG